MASGQSLPKIIRFLLMPVFHHILTPTDYGVLELATQFGAFRVLPFMRIGACPGRTFVTTSIIGRGAALKDYATTVA